MILQIDVTVTGPDSVLTGSVAVDVNVPAATLVAQAEVQPAPADAPGPNEQAAVYSQAMKWGQR